jgi:DNA-binding NarL/FixJ family response regulator
MTVRIVLADDHKIMREGLRSLLSQQKDFEILAEAEDGRAVVDLVQQHRPDVVIMDVTMPELNGIEATRQILAGGAATRVIALSMHPDRHFVGEMFKAGASGYLLKLCASEELAQAIRHVVAGHHYISPSIAGTVLKDYKEFLPADVGSPTAVLSEREREVLQLLAEGKGTKEIAQVLHVSPKTVDTHRRQIMTKLKLNSVAELVKYAIREGLTTLGQ